MQRLILRTGVETAAFPGQSQEEIDRLLHVVRVEKLEYFRSTTF